MIIEEIFHISKYPELAHDTKSSFGDKVIVFLKVCGLLLVAVFLTAMITTLADYFVTHIGHLPSIRSQNQLKHIFEKMGYTAAVIYVCLLGPILEELIFRLPLSFKRRHIALSFAFAVFLFSGFIPYLKQYQGSTTAITVLAIKTVMGLAVYFATAWFLPRDLSVNVKLKKAMIIVSMLLFGLMHISNYAPLQWPVIWIYPVYVSTQLVMGWAITFLRFTNGFIWGIILHCTINSTSMSLMMKYKEAGKAKRVVPKIVSKPEKLKSPAYFLTDSIR